MRTRTVLRASSRPPLIRQAGDGGAATVYGIAVPWNVPSEIDNWIEGHFLERFAPGAFSRSIVDDRDRIRAMFSHGRGAIGDLPIGNLITLRDDGVGLRFELDLFAVDYAEQLLPAIGARQLGTSVRFQIEAESIVMSPPPSDANPLALPEITVTRARLWEVSLVPFPQYDGTTAALRSMAEWWHEQNHTVPATV